MRVVLGIDTATRATAVALGLQSGQTLEARDDPATGDHPGHATRLLDLTAGLLDQAGIDWGALELIAVGIGPGTFTGLRIGVASARGLGQSLGVALTGVSSLAALAHPALAQLENNDLDGVLAVLDARRGEAFAAAYTAAGELLAARALAPEALPGILPDTESNDRWLAVGDGALRFEETLSHSGFKIPPADSPLHLLSARATCALGYLAPHIDGRELLPDYCRRPDAELTLEGRPK